MPTNMMAYIVFKDEDFKSVESMSVNNIPVRLWARSNLVDKGLAKASLDLSVKIYDQLLDIFKNVNPNALPEKIDIFAIPDYPVIFFLY